MSYVIYEKESTAMVIINRTRTSSYSNESSAKRDRTKMTKNGQLDENTEYCISESQYYANNIVKMVTRTNLMSGEEYQESINTPNSCSPASETYWSM